MSIDWNAFKEFKAQSYDESDNFTMLIKFLKSFYNVHSAYALYDMMKDDGLSVAMMQKRNIDSADALERYIYGV